MNTAHLTSGKRKQVSHGPKALQRSFTIIRRFWPRRVKNDNMATPNTSKRPLVQLRKPKCTKKMSILLSPYKLSLLSLCALTVSGPAPAEEISDWIARNAAPLSSVELSAATSDLTPLKSIVEEARIVGFGEGTHDAHELWSLRNRLFAYLVEEAGVTAIAAETGLTQAQLTDAYVRGENVDRLAAGRGVFSWSGSVFEENLELIDWMRAYNARPETARRVRFYGLEMTGCMDADGRPLIEGALSYISGVAPERSEAMRQAFAPLLQQLNRRKAHTISGAQSDRLVIASQDLVSLFERYQTVWIERTGKDAFQQAYRQAVAVRQLTAHLRMGGEGRDIAAAENLRWALEQEGPDGRLFVFAHNSHIAKWRLPPESEDDRHSTMGELISDYLAEDYIAIGSLYNGGEARDLLGLFRPVNEVYEAPPAKTGSLNAVAASIDAELFFLDLSQTSEDAPAKNWFVELKEIRNLNVRTGYHKIDTLKAFDALMFVETLTPLRIAQAPEPATNARACYVADTQP